MKPIFKYIFGICDKFHGNIFLKDSLFERLAEKMGMRNNTSGKKILVETNFSNTYKFKHLWKEISTYRYALLT